MNFQCRNLIGTGAVLRNTVCTMFNVSPAPRTETGPPYSSFSMFEVASCSNRQYVSFQGLAWTSRHRK